MRIVYSSVVSLLIFGLCIGCGGPEAETHQDPAPPPSGDPQMGVRAEMPVDSPPRGSEPAENKDAEEAAHGRPD
jgi:hypothetical protein